MKEYVPILPLPQSPEFARTIDLLGKFTGQHVMQLPDGRALQWHVQSRNFGPFGTVDLVSRGPVTHTPSDWRFWLQHWRAFHGTTPLLLNPLGLAAEDLTAAGFWPLMSAAHLGILHLADRDSMRMKLHQKWRNRLVRSEGHGARVTTCELSDYHWILSAEKAQAKAQGYRGLPPGFSLAFAKANPGKSLILEAQHSGDVIAAILILRHGKMATWQIGHSTPKGRQLNAMNLLLWHAMVTLNDLGHSHLDLGILNDDDAPGLTHFKLGTGATAQRQSGTWLHMNVLAPLARRLPLWMAGSGKIEVSASIASSGILRHPDEADIPSLRN